MKRKLAIATITTAALIGTGTVSAAAMADDGGQKSAQVTSAQYSGDDRDRPADERDDRDDRDEDRDDRDGKDDDRNEAVSPSGLKISAADAADKAASKGTVTSVDLDDDRKNLVWEVETSDKNGKQQEFLVDADSGKLTEQPADDDRADGPEDRDDKDDDRDADDKNERDDDGPQDD